jgi:hypothetical protein
LIVGFGANLYLLLKGNVMKLRSMLIAAVIAMSALLIGCKDDSTSPQGEVDSAEQKSLMEMGEDMADETQENAEEAADKTKDAAESLKNDLEE